MSWKRCQVRASVPRASSSSPCGRPSASRNLSQATRRQTTDPLASVVWTRLPSGASVCTEPAMSSRMAVTCRHAMARRRNVRLQSVSQINRSTIRQLVEKGSDRMSTIPVNIKPMPLRQTIFRPVCSVRRTTPNTVDDTCDFRIDGLLSSQKIAGQFRVRERQKPAKCRLVRIVHGGVVCLKPAGQQDIKLAHATSALPFEFLIAHQASVALCARGTFACPGPTRTVSSMPSFGQHLLGFGDRLGRVQVLGTGIRAIHDRMATIQPERVLEIIQPFAGRLVTTVDQPTIGR